MLLGGAGGGGQTAHAGGRGGNGAIQLQDGATLSVAEHILIGGSSGGGTIAGTNGGQGGEGRLIMDNAVVILGPGGRLRLGAGAAGGPGELELGPGELRFGAGSTFVINSNGYLQIGGTPSAGRPAGTIQGLSVVQNDGHIVFNQTGNARLDARIVGTGEVRTNRGTTYLTADNTYTGWTWIIAGSTLNLGANGNSGNLAGPVHVEGTLVLERSDASTFSAPLNGNGVIRKAGAGTPSTAPCPPTPAC